MLEPRKSPALPCSSDAFPLPVAPPPNDLEATCHRKGSGDGGEERDWDNGGGHVDGFEVRHKEYGPGVGGAAFQPLTL